MDLDGEPGKLPQQYKSLELFGLFVHILSL